MIPMATAANRVHMVGIDDLDIDRENLRGSVWEMDEKDQELVESVKTNGILEPMLVRPAGPKDRVEYTIISGARRYNAAIEAGLTEVPCIVRDVDDLTAAGISVMENRDRKDVPTWLVAFKVIEWYDKINGASTKSEKTGILATKFGCSPRTVKEYTELAILPPSLQELVKDPSQWSKETQELVKGLLEDLPDIPAKGLSIEKAAMIARELYSDGTSYVPERTLFELGARSILESREVLRDVLARVKEYPKEPIADVFEMVTERERTIRREEAIRVLFPRSLMEPIDMAASKRQMNRKELVGYYVREGLKRDGFL